MDKLSMQSVDGVAANIDIIARHFPSCITEARDPEGQLVHGIDFEKLKAELSSSCIPDKAERYQFTWPGKMDAARLANQPSAATLRPCREESEDFDSTSNLYIEGDNLEVLKVLRNTYAGKVKMIYIDPPYNTGGDLVYEDDFAMEADDFLVRSGQRDEDGVRLTVNTESNGRFHTDWLNMIYPRLKLAREFLSEDGVIFISIDDNEHRNLRKVCDEIFGEQNCLGEYVKQSKVGGGNDSKFIVKEHEYCLCYSKRHDLAAPMYQQHDEEYLKRYKERDESGAFFWDTFARPGLKNPIVYTIEAPDGTPITNGWIRSKERFIEEYRQGKIRITKKKDGSWSVQFKQYLNPNGKTPRSLTSDFGGSSLGDTDIKSLFGTKVFNYPKSVKFVSALISTIADKDALIMDFFSGSSTSAHAAMRLNSIDGGHRRFIMIQVPQSVDSDTTAGKEAIKAGYSNICEIGKERIRRAGAAIKAESGPMAGELDTGFRVLKLDSSNMKDVYYSADEVSLGGFSEFNIKDDRSGEDLLFQVMLDLGIELSSSIEVRSLEGHTVYVVNDGYLAASFDDRVSLDAARAIAGLKPHWFVMCDAAFGSDADADNIKQVFSGLSEATQIKVI